MKRIKKRAMGAIAVIATVIGMLLPAKTASTTALPEPDPIPLPMAGGDMRRLTPRQYLWLSYPKEAPLMDRIINCESGWTPAAKNRGSTASGLAQFLAGTWSRSRIRLGRDPALELRFDPYENIDTAIWLLRNAGPTQWECFTLKMI